MAEPFYGVDGDLLVEDLPYNREDVEAILDGTSKPRFWAHQMLPGILMLMDRSATECSPKRNIVGLIR